MFGTFIAAFNVLITEHAGESSNDVLPKLSIIMKTPT